MSCSSCPSNYNLKIKLIFNQFLWIKFKIEWIEFKIEPEWSHVELNCWNIIMTWTQKSHLHVLKMRYSCIKSSLNLKVKFDYWYSLLIVSQKSVIKIIFISSRIWINRVIFHKRWHPAMWGCIYNVSVHSREDLGQAKFLSCLQISLSLSWSCKIWCSTVAG